MDRHLAVGRWTQSNDMWQDAGQSIEAVCGVVLNSDLDSHRENS
jgi:hypothetical protein